jgi:hypothetical protein
VRRHRGDAAEQVEKDEASVSDAIFHVVAEDPEEQHVAEKVCPSAMQKHRCKNGDEVEAHRDDTVRADERLARRFG